MYWFFWLRSMAQSPGCNGFVARTWELPPRQVAFGTPPSFILSQGLPARGTPPGPNSNTSLSALSMTWNLADSLARRNAALAAEAARQAAAAALVANAAQAAQRGQARGAEAEAATPGEAPAGRGGSQSEEDGDDAAPAPARRRHRKQPTELPDEDEDPKPTELAPGLEAVMVPNAYAKRGASRWGVRQTLASMILEGQDVPEIPEGQKNKDHKRAKTTLCSNERLGWAFAFDQSTIADTKNQKTRDWNQNLAVCPPPPPRSPAPPARPPDLCVPMRRVGDRHCRAASHRR